MAGANYMGGKRNRAKARNRDTVGKAERRFFGQQRFNLAIRRKPSLKSEHQTPSRPTSILDIGFSHAKSSIQSSLRGYIPDPIHVNSRSKLSKLSDDANSSDIYSSKVLQILDSTEPLSVRAAADKVLALPDLAGLCRSNRGLKRHLSPQLATIARQHSKKLHTSSPECDDTNRDDRSPPMSQDYLFHRRYGKGASSPSNSIGEAQDEELPDTLEQQSQSSSYGPSHCNDHLVPNLNSSSNPQTPPNDMNLPDEEEDDIHGLPYTSTQFQAGSTSNIDHVFNCDDPWRALGVILGFEDNWPPLRRRDFGALLDAIPDEPLPQSDDGYTVPQHLTDLADSPDAVQEAGNISDDSDSTFSSTMVHHFAEPESVPPSSSTSGQCRLSSSTRKHLTVLSPDMSSPGSIGTLFAARDRESRLSESPTSLFSERRSSEFGYRRNSVVSSPDAYLLTTPRTGFENRDGFRRLSDPPTSLFFERRSSGFGYQHNSPVSSSDACLLATPRTGFENMVFATIPPHSVAGDCSPDPRGFRRRDLESNVAPQTPHISSALAMDSPAFNHSERFLHYNPSRTLVSALNRKIDSHVGALRSQHSAHASFVSAATALSAEEDGEIPTLLVPVRYSSNSPREDVRGGVLLDVDQVAVDVNHSKESPSCSRSDNFENPSYTVAPCNNAYFAPGSDPDQGEENISLARESLSMQVCHGPALFDDEDFEEEQY
ncbi:hypothetical protein D9758_002022 [Tetrapyrgos nigripes]|uniref:Uncharacterized protein n=1 Tax=Tetrapyrgos nigripes TaxID=182062 RepID=A0A8H5GTP8_9AGAR|nr:hypothetical protein D9758_002022 [Tetrapyrgos nigripes]